MKQPKSYGFASPGIAEKDRPSESLTGGLGFAPRPRPLAISIDESERRRSLARHYLVASLAPFVIAGVLQATWPLLRTNPVQPFLLAVIVCAWYGGLGPGVLCLSLSFLVSDFYFVEPYFAFWFPRETDLIRLILFVVIGLFICVMSEVMRRQKQRAEPNLAAANRGEEALRASEAQFHTMANSIPQLAWMAHADGFIFWYNQPWHDYTGMTAVQMEGWGWQSVHDPEVLPRVMEKWQAAIATGQPFEMEFPLRGADGTFRQFLTRVRPFKNSQGDVVRWFGTNTDVDQLKRMEMSLRETREQLGLFIEHAPAAIAMLDCDMNYLAASNRWFSDYGIEDRDIIGRSHYQVFPDVPDQWRSVHRRCLSGAVERNEGEAWAREDGGTDWVRWEIRPWRNSDDSIGGLIIFSEVITDRKQAEKQIHDLNRLYAVLIDINQMIVRTREPQAIFSEACRIAVDQGKFRMAWVGIFDQENHCIEPQAWAGVEDGYLTARKFDLSDPLVAQGPTATSIREGQHVICNDLETDARVANWCDEIKQRGYRSSAAFPLRVDGELVGSFNLYSIEQGFFDDQEVVLLDELAMDISFALEIARRERERQQAETALHAKSQELAAMTQQLWQTSKLATVGELAASIAHELNNPLTTVTLSVEALTTQLAGDESKLAILATVNHESGRMADLISNLLEFSRRSHAQISSLNLGDELRSSLTLIDYQLRSRNIKVVEDIASDLPLVQADRQQLLQVFLNLLTNASDAMPGGGVITLRARSADLNEEQPRVLIEFADTGRGIEATHLQKIWEPFVTTKPEGKGTGLGLSICRRAVEEHGGTIDVECLPGEGATFRILLPVTKSKTHAAGREKLIVTG